MKRVLHVLDAFMYRSEIFVYTYIRAHKRYQADVLCRTLANASEFSFDRVHVLAEPRTKLDARWWMSRASEALFGESWWSAGATELVRRVGPDVIHAHFGPTGCAMVPAARTLRIPLVTSFYGVDLCVLPRLPQWRGKYQTLFREGQRFLVEGPVMRSRAVAAGVPDARLDIQRIAINSGAYPQWQPHDGAPSVLFVGRFVEKKGLLDALEAIARARIEMPALTATIVGDGPERVRAEAIVDTHRMRDAVTFVGMQPHSRVLTLLQRAHALIHPSVVAEDGDAEGGAPTILLEAQAIGTPVVTTNHADIPNVVVPGPGLRLCPERDVEALAVALVSVLRAHVASDASLVRTHHDIRTEIDRLEAQYDAVCIPEPAVAATI